ncbi:hypothetical protein RHSIM_Rhsim06G0140300 [Rhododendron simsii]|uniref:O-acyltransferase WSD1 C-terminal domain-containing protein n=1 Tax=Rhododendron simsii TaxID=118357 RepID=A0A834LKT8_RHOSS|nr:hypothetical protein RHSIM_Rhsim06G0140300 [Rhododendron simsii]
MEYYSDEGDMPVSPNAQYFNSSVLSFCILGVLELEIPFDDSQSLTLLKNLFLPINPRFSSVMQGNTNATALVVLNTRALGGYTTIEEMVKPKSETPWGNHLTFLHVSIPKLTGGATDDHANLNPLRFVKEAHWIIKRKRNSAVVYLTGWMLEILRKFRGPESLAITIMRYVGELRITIRMEKGFMDPRKFNSCSEKAFNMIFKAAIQNTPPSNS